MRPFLIPAVKVGNATSEDSAGGLRSLRAAPAVATPCGSTASRMRGVFCVRIQRMKPRLPQPVHLSYKKHRRQLAAQIILPIVAASLVGIGLAYLVSAAAVGHGGDYGRWAAISTIWLAVPLMIAGVLLLALVVGLIYLLALGLHWLPTYTGKAQDYAYKGRRFVRRLANQVVRPVMAFEGLRASIRAILGRR